MLYNFDVFEKATIIAYFILTIKLNQLIKLVTLGKIVDVIFYKLEVIITYFKVQ